MGIWPINSLGLLSSLRNQWVRLNRQFVKFAKHQNFLEMFVKSVDAPHPRNLDSEDWSRTQELAFLPNHTQELRWYKLSIASWSPGNCQSPPSSRTLIWFQESALYQWKAPICHTVSLLSTFPKSTFQVLSLFPKICCRGTTWVHYTHVFPELPLSPLRRIFVDFERITTFHLQVPWKNIGWSGKIRS